jgi:hypothetical protein
MTNYAQPNKRFTLTFSVRKQGAETFYDLLKYCKVRYDVDVPGEPTVWIEPTVNALPQDNASGGDTIALIEGIEFVTGNPYSGAMAID